MRYVAGLLLLVIGVATLPIPSHLLQSGIAWAFAGMSTLCFYGAYRMFYVKPKGDQQGPVPPTAE